MAITTTTTTVRKPGLLRRLIERPQQVWLRKALFQVHLWAGILLALYVIAIGVSGSILVFKEELMPKPRVNVGYVDYNSCTPEKLQQAVNAANHAFPGMKAFLTACPTPANSLYAITVRSQVKRAARRGASGAKVPQRTIYIHPNTGAVLGQAAREDSWLETVEQLHVNLLLGRGGRLWNGIGASVLLAITLTGMVLWWPGIKNWTRGLKLDFRKSWKRINFDLHNAMGFWTVFFTLTWALTGMYFTWPKIFTTPLQMVSKPVTAVYPGKELQAAMAKLNPNAPDGRGGARGSRIAAETPTKPASDGAAKRTADSARTEANDASPTGMPRKEEPRVNVDAMLAEAQRQSPDGHLEGYFYGAGSRAVFTVYMARGILGDYSDTDFVYFDQLSGSPLYTWHRGKNQTVADWCIWLIAPLHFGTSWGEGVKFLWALLGLTLPALTITGLLMYWNRWLSKRWPKASVSVIR